MKTDPVVPEDETLLARKRLNFSSNEPLDESPGLAQSEKEEKTSDSRFITDKFLRTFKEDAPPFSIFLLNLVALIWGTQHAVIKAIVDDSEASIFTLLRFFIAAIIASPYTPRPGSVIDEQLGKTWRWGLEMGIWMFLGFSLQAVGLAYTTASRSGFLIYLNVKLVPFFARIFYGRPISVQTWVSAFAAFAGTGLLAMDGHSIGLNIGDIWTVVAAASSAMFILRLEQATLQVDDSASLNSACLWTVVLLSFMWNLGSIGLSVDDIQDTVEEASRIASSHFLQLLYLGGVTTALSNFIQTKAQKDVSAERASVIYSLDPVYGAFFSFWLLGEKLGGFQAYFGAALITVAAATNVFLDLGSKDDSKRRAEN